MGYKLKRILIYPDGVTEKQVYPAGWKPGANTIAYFPFEDDQLDKVGSSSISIIGTKQTLGYNFNFTGAATISNITNSKFCCFWVKFGAIKSNTQNTTPTLGLGELTYNYFHTNTSFSQTFSYQYSSSGWGSSTYNTSSGQRYFLAYGYTGTNAVAYANGIKVMDVQTSLYSGSNWRLGFSIDETLSELIFEDRCRTAQEVADYYNLTKSNYGL